MCTKNCASPLMRQGWKLPVLAIVVALGLGACGSKDEDGGGSGSGSNGGGDGTISKEYLVGYWAGSSGTCIRKSAEGEEPEDYCHECYLCFNEMGIGFFGRWEMTEFKLEGNTLTGESTKYKQSGKWVLEYISKNFCKINGSVDVEYNKGGSLAIIEGTLCRLSGKWVDANRNATLYVDEGGGCTLNNQSLDEEYSLIRIVKEKEEYMEVESHCKKSSTTLKGTLSKDANTLIIYELNGVNYAFKRQ